MHMLGREFTRRAVACCLALVATLLAGGATPPALAAMPGAAGAVGAVPIVGGVDGGAFAGGTLALITEASSTVTFVDPSTLNVRATAVLPQAPVAVAMSPDGALAYVAGKNSITVVDTTNGASLHTASYPGLGIGCNSMTMGSKAEYIEAQLVISPDGTRLSTLAVGCGRTSNVWVIDPVSLAVIGMALVYRESYGSVDYPGTILATNSSTLVTKKLVERVCQSALLPAGINPRDTKQCQRPMRGGESLLGRQERHQYARHHADAVGLPGDRWPGSGPWVRSTARPDGPVASRSRPWHRSDHLADSRLLRQGGPRRCSGAPGLRRRRERRGPQRRQGARGPIGLDTPSRELLLCLQ